VVIAGCGFLGEAAAALFLGAEWRVLGICSSAESADRLRTKGLAAAAADISQEVIAPEEWQSPDVLIHSASSGRGGADAYRAVYLEGLRNLLAAYRPRHLIFTGSTSVYGQVDGSWVKEESPAEPSRETGQILLAAEKLALEAGGCVARLSGIYGPGRSVLLRKFLEGSALLEAGGVRWINQIHRDDGAAALFHLATTKKSGVFNVCDDTPATQETVYGWIAEFLQRPLPPIGPADLDRKRGWTNKRVSNAKLRSLGWKPTFPSYRDALPGLLAQHEALTQRS
jgi:nucleoside-diphosphate-sugar epimerase